MVWKRYPRYEIETWGMKQKYKVWKINPKYEEFTVIYKMRFQVWNRVFLDKKWVFIPLWVDFIPFWVWKKSLFFSDAKVNTERLAERECVWARSCVGNIYNKLWKSPNVSILDTHGTFPQAATSTRSPSTTPRT